MRFDEIWRSGWPYFDHLRLAYMAFDSPNGQLEFAADAPLPYDCEGQPHESYRHLVEEKNAEQNFRVQLYEMRIILYF